jgi:hypothetical protein
VNHRDRRHSHDPLSATRIRELQHRVEQTGQPGIIHGLTGGCMDCSATATLTLLPGGQVIGDIFHDPFCPAAAGTIEWSPAQ